MKVLLFDWFAGGHHELYLRHFASVLAEQSEVYIAAPAASHHRLRGVPATICQLEPRPPVDESKHLSTGKRAVAKKELALLDDVAGQVGAQHAIHMFADGVLRVLALRPRRASARLTICLFRPRAHYPSMYSSSLSLVEWSAAQVFERLLKRWRGREDAHAVLTLDEGAALRWNTGAGAPAFWLPEPPVPRSDHAEGDRRGCLVYGSLSARKGIDLLADALSSAPTTAEVLLAGSVPNGYLPCLHDHVRAMQAAGAQVTLWPRQFSEREGLSLLAGARCTVLPYVSHYGMSRVLLESASVGTPVVVHNTGLLGHLVTTNHLGLAVDSRDKWALRTAVEHFTQGGATLGPYVKALQAFAARYSPAAFRAAVEAPYIGDPLYYFTLEGHNC